MSELLDEFLALLEQFGELSELGVEERGASRGRARGTPKRSCKNAIIHLGCARMQLSAGTT